MPLSRLYTFGMASLWSTLLRFPIWTRDQKIQALIFAVVLFGFVYAVAKDLLTAFLGRKRLRFLDLTISRNAAGFVRLDFNFSNAGHHPIKLRKTYLLDRNGTEYGSRDYFDHVLNHGINNWSCVYVDAPGIEDKDIKCIAVEDTVRESPYLGYICGGKFVSFWNYYLNILKEKVKSSTPHLS